MQNKLIKILLFFLFFGLIFFRSPYIFFNGRFMSEEGTIFFANAFNHGFLYSLLFVDFNSGYINFWANLSGIFASWFPLEFSPRASNLFSAMPMLIVTYYILFEKSYLFLDLKKKIIGCLLVIVSPFIVTEVWLNSINSQIFLGIFTLITALINFENCKLKFTVLFLLFISGISGVYSCALTPIFLYKYIKFGNSQDKYNFYILLICTILQFLLIIYSKTSGSLYPGKIHGLNFDLIINYFYNIIVKSFFGYSITNYFLKFLKLNIFFYILIISIFGLFLFYFSIKFLKNTVSSNFTILSLTYSFLAISGLVLIGAVDNYVGGRYAVLPSLSLVLIIFAFSIFVTNKNFSYILSFFVFFSLSVGIYEYKFNNKYKHFILCYECPNWKNEVAKWKKNKNYPLKIWPYTANKVIILY